MPLEWFTARSDARYWLKIAISAYPPAFDVPVRGGLRRNIVVPFGIAKLEWCGYPTVKNFDHAIIRFDTIHECNRRTDTQTDTA